MNLSPPVHTTDCLVLLDLTILIIRMFLIFSLSLCYICFEYSIVSFASHSHTLSACIPACEQPNSVKQEENYSGALLILPV
jgi:hypothetical protein